MKNCINLYVVKTVLCYNNESVITFFSTSLNFDEKIQKPKIRLGMLVTQTPLKIQLTENKAIPFKCVMKQQPTSTKL